MKTLILLVFTFISVAAHAEDPILTRMGSPRFVPLPEQPIVRCDVYKDHVVLTTVKLGVGVSVTKNTSLVGDIDAAITEVKSAPLQVYKEYAGPPFYQYSAKGSTFKIMGENAIAADTPTTDTLVYIIEQACK